MIHIRLRIVLAATAVAVALSPGAQELSDFPVAAPVTDPAENVNLVAPPDPDQEGATEVSVAYSGLPAMRFIPTYHNHWNRMNPWGCVTVSIDHRFAPRLWFGLSYSISSASTSEVGGNREGAITWHSLLVQCRYDYYKTRRLSVYGSVGVGVLISYIQPENVPTFNRSQFAFQVAPVGVSWRALTNLDLFADAGFGVQGILRLGFRIDF